MKQKHESIEIVLNKTAGHRKYCYKTEKIWHQSWTSPVVIVVCTVEY